MGKVRNNSLFATLVAMPLFLLLVVSTVSRAEDVATSAPLNPALLAYMSKKASLKAQTSTATAPPHAFGYIPEPIDYSYLRGQQVPQAFQRLALPASFDLRTLGKVTPVRDQGSCGACWTFATMGSAESELLPGETRDFSENNLKNTAGWLWGACDGGNGTMATAYLARWSGPVNESDDPYNDSSTTSPPGLPVQKHYQDITLIPGRANATDNNNIKQALMSYGAVYTSYYHDDAYYSPTGYGYYYTGSTTSNHAVTIVGWDDTFSASRFPTAPPGNGAFIIKNSWGAGWGESGFFYISYYDTRMGMDSNYAFKAPETTANYNRVYQYDPLGGTSGVGYSSTTAWGANIFTAAASENLSAVAFHAPALNSAYEIDIYTNATSGPTSGTLAGTTTGTLTEAGYHTVKLTTPVPLTNGQKFAIVLKLTSPDYSWPISVEKPIAGVVSPTANAGESYISSSGTSWTDITTISGYANTNVCIKGFTAVPPDTTPPTVTATTPVANATGFPVNAKVTVTFSESMDPATLTATTFSLNNGVSGTVTYNDTTFTATLAPSAYLAPNTLYTATVTTGVKDRAGNPMAAPHTWSFTTGASNPTNQLFANPDFETGDVGWTSRNCDSATSPTCYYVINQNNGLGHNGSNWYAMLGSGSVNGMTGYLYQDVTIPANATAATLQFWYRISTNETGSTPYDTMSLVVADPATGNVTATLDTWSNADTTNGLWVQSPPYDLLAYKGQTVRVEFKAETDSSLPTTFRVDDATLAVTAPATKQQLTVAIGGTGDCSVNSIPSAIACTKGGGVCSAGFDSGTSVTLTATPDANSLFGGWSGACSNASGDCVVTMDAAKSATATCTFVQPVRIPSALPTYFPTLQAAFDAAATNNTIQARAYELTENAVLSRAISVFIKGGHDPYFSSIVGTTVINGSLTIGVGSATAENLTLR